MGRVTSRAIKIGARVPFGLLLLGAAALAVVRARIQDHGLGLGSPRHYVSGGLECVLTVSLLGTLGMVVASISVARAKRLWRSTFVVVVIGGVTMMVAHTYVTRWGIRSTSPRDGIFAMMAGTASRPFVFRRLAPDVVAAGTNLLETRVPARYVNAYLDKSTLMSLYDTTGFDRHRRIALHIAYLFVWSCLFGTVLAATALLREVVPIGELQALVSACLALSLLPVTLGNGGYIYDSAEYLLCTGLLFCVSRGWLYAALSIFTLLVVNKESAAALVPVLWPLLARHLGAKRALTWTALAGFMACAWLVFIRQRYASRAGEDQAFQLWSNMAFWIKPTSYFKFGSMFSPALPAPRGANLLILLLFAIPVRFGWSSLRTDFKLASVIAAVIFVPLFLISGCYDETRALGPLFPILLVAASQGVTRLFGEECSDAARPPVPR